MKSLYIFAGGLVIAAVGLPAAASAATTLTFDGAICGAPGNQACGNGSEIGQNYGDVAGVIDISHRAFNANTGVTSEAYLKYWASSYGDLVNVVWGGTDASNFTAEITFAPGAGYEVALISLDAGCYVNRASCQTMNYDIATGGGVDIAVGSTPTLYPGHATLNVNSGYHADGIVLRWGPDSYDVGLDNITFDVRAISTTPVVPEPASWAMMIAGFGLVGGAMRRRQTASRAIA